MLAGTASISGSVYNDLNSNGLHEAGEAGIKNVRIFLDSNGNKRWDKGKEPSTRTDTRGGYAFEHLDAATYRVRHVVDSHTSVTAPRSDWFKVTVADGQHVTRRLFGDYAPPARTTPAVGSGDVLHGDVDFNGNDDSTDYNLIDFNTIAHPGWGDGDGTLPTAVTPSIAPPPTTVSLPSAKSTAKADFKLTHNDHSLLSAKAWLGGNKDQIRSSGLQTVIDHYHRYGVEYKREFLKLANAY